MAKRKHKNGKSVISNNNNYRDKRGVRKNVTARAKGAVQAKAVVKAGDKFKGSLSGANLPVGQIETVPAGFQPKRLAAARALVHDTVAMMPDKDARLQTEAEMKAHIEEGLAPSPVLEKAAMPGVRLNAQEQQQANQDASEIMENLADTVRDHGAVLGYKAPKWDAASAQVFGLAGALNETITTVDAIGKAAQVNGDIPEDGQSWDPGTLTVFREDGRRFSLKPLLVNGIWARTLEVVKGAAIKFDSSAKKAFLDTDAVVLEAIDSTLPTGGISFHPVEIHSTKELWAAYALTFKAANAEDTRPYGFEPQSFEWEEYPTEKCRRYYRIRATVPYSRTSGAPIWPTEGFWKRRSASLFQPNDAAANLEGNVRLDQVSLVLNFGPADLKKTHKETLTQFVDIPALIVAGYTDIEIEVAQVRYTRMRLTPTLDSYAKDLTRQGIAMLGSTSGARDVSSLASLFLTGPGWDVLAQSSNAAAAFTTITELFGTPKEIAPTKRTLK